MSVEAISANLASIIGWILGDYQDVQARALRSGSTQRWRRRQTAGGTAAMAGAACVSGIPGAGLAVGIPANLVAATWVVRRMAHSAWGIGARMAQGVPGAVVDPEADLVAILAFWAGASRDEITNIATRIKNVHKPLTTSALAVAALPQASIGAELLKKIATQLYQRFGKKIAKKIQAWLTKKLFGFIPVAGVVISTASTWLLMREFSNFAQRYYLVKFGQE